MDGNCEKWREREERQAKGICVKVEDQRPVDISGCIKEQLDLCTQQIFIEHLLYAKNCAGG